MHAVPKLVRLSGAIVAPTLLLGACASGGALFDKAKEMVGLGKPAAAASPEQPAQPQKLTLRVHTGDVLNTDGNGRSLPLVTKIYKLRDSAAFLRTPYEAFQAPAVATRGAAPAALPFASDVLEERELILSPGSKHEVVETMPADARFLAVVALFRAPAEGRWRFAFDAKSSGEAGVTLGAHACAMSVTAGATVGSAPEMNRLAGVRCP